MSALRAGTPPHTPAGPSVPDTVPGAWQALSSLLNRPDQSSHHVSCWFVPTPSLRPALLCPTSGWSAFITLKETAPQKKGRRRQERLPPAQVLAVLPTCEPRGLLAWGPATHVARAEGLVSPEKWLPPSGRSKASCICTENDTAFNLEFFLP